MASANGPEDLAPELDRERRQLSRSRAALARMRERAEQIGDAGADPLASEALGAARRRRLAALADDPAVPLFFGRLDQRSGEVFHIGRRHVRDESGDPLVIDWRAALARAYYRATPADPMDVRRRRRFGFAAGRLTSFEDESLDVSPDVAARLSRIVLDEIERPRVGPMRDIVATIQPDQDDIVRAGLDDSICVQGGPGTGKTAVGLHRAAYLLYTYAARLRHTGVLVVGPNRAFLAYVAAVLPALGEIDVTQVGLGDLCRRVALRGVDPPEVARLKGDVRMARVIRRAVYAGIRRPVEPVVVPVGLRRYRVAPDRLARWADDLRRGDLPYGVVRDRLATLAAYEVRRQMEAEGATPTDRTVERIARSAPVRAAVDWCWPAVEPIRLVFRLLADADFLAAVSSGLLSDAERVALHWADPPPAPSLGSGRARWTGPSLGSGRARWTLADDFLVDEAAGLIERLPSYGHVVVDEAQDLSAMQCRAIARRSTMGSLTVLGDLAQGTTAWAATDWPSALELLGKPTARLQILTLGYRVPQQVLDLANRLLPHLGAGLGPTRSIRPGRDAVRLAPVASLASGTVTVVRDALAAPGSIGVVTAERTAVAVQRALRRAELPIGPVESPDARIAVVPAALVKGLEFDTVVLVEPAEILEDESGPGLRLLYVALTRAVSRLTIVHARPLPALLLGSR